MEGCHCQVLAALLPTAESRPNEHHRIVRCGVNWGKQVVGESLASGRLGLEYLEVGDRIARRCFLGDPDENEMREPGVATFRRIELGCRAHVVGARVDRLAPR